jgi:hypothetical protein
MDKDIQKIAGYQLSEPLLGWVKSTDVSTLDFPEEMRLTNFEAYGHLGSERRSK